MNDIRYALRGLRRNPGFTSAAVLSLALGIGANTAVFSLFQTLMLRMLPVSRPAELVTLYRTGAWGPGHSSYPLYRELAGRTDLFTGVAACTDVSQVRFSSGHAEFARREFVSGNYFAVLGVSAGLGRLFLEGDNLIPKAHPLAILSDDFWRSRFGADRAVLGRTLVVDDQPLTVIGVAPPGFRGVDVERHPDIWVPLMMYPGSIQSPGMHWLSLIARRRPPVSRRQIQAAADVLLRQYLAATYGATSNAAFRQMAMNQHMEVREGGLGMSLLRDRFAKPLSVLMAAVGLVLLAACANVANLLLARGAMRQKEIALRLGLGATRGRLVRQALTESLVLAASGSVMGILFAWWCERGILRFLPAASVAPFESAPDPVILVFTLSLSLFSVFLFGLAPALRSTAVDPVTGLRAGGLHVPGRRRPTLRSALVIAQVAFSVVLVVLAGLFGHSLAAMRAVDLGFRNQNVLAFSLDFPRTWKPEAIQAARARFLAQAESMPGVSSVTYSFPGPFQDGSWTSTLRVPGSAQPETDVSVDLRNAAPRFFETLAGTPLLGREFDRTDTAGSRKVAVVNQAFVRQFLPGFPNPLGQTLVFGEGNAPVIVGLVRDIRSHSLSQEPKPAVYLPASQLPGNWPPTILIRSQLPPSAIVPGIRRELEKLGAGVAMSEPQTIRQQIDDSIFQQRMLATLGGFFGALALLLAAVGLYGVVAYGTARRAAEIGIRIALGARRSQVLWMVLRHALLLVVLGLAAGLPFALAVARMVNSLLFGIKPADPLTFVTTAAVLAAIGLAAAFLPAHRAATLDPTRVLRHE
jgi:predicted permease